MAVCKKMLYAREVSSLFREVGEDYHEQYPQAGRVTNSVLFAFAWDTLQKHPGYSGIRWADVARASVVDPADVAPNPPRYGSSLTLPVSLYPAIDFPALAAFRAERKADFCGIRRNVYLPFCVRLILKAYCMCCRG